MFYENFERLCLDKGIKPSRACIDAGLDANRSSNWKKTGALPKQNELHDLARVLDCFVADFFTEDNVPVAPNGKRLDDYELALLSIFDDLEVEDRADVILYARNLRNRREQEIRERCGA